jgi:16S rRNA U516 pseudouridylate synthase RsuA-like enzyme
MTDTSTRLNKFIALHTGVSRREAEKAIDEFERALKLLNVL